MKALRILLVVAMSMLLVSSAFAQEFSVGGNANFSVSFDSTEVGDADAATDITLGSGGEVSLEGSASKELDNGATVEISGTALLEMGSIANDGISLKYTNGPLTVSMLEADRPGAFGMGKDEKVLYDPVYEGEFVGEQGIAFAYAAESMTFTTTVNYANFETDDDDAIAMNRIGVRPHVEMKAGSATITAAVEYLAEFPTNTDADGPTTANFGGGANVEAALGNITVGAAAAYGIEGGTDEAGDDVDATDLMAVYGYATMAVGAGEVGVGGGYNVTSIENVDDDATSMQVNAAYSQGDIVVPGLELIIAAGYGVAEDSAKVETTKSGATVTLEYSF